MALSYEEAVNVLKSLSNQELRQLGAWYEASVQLGPYVSLNLIGTCISEHEIKKQNAYKCVMARTQHEELYKFIALVKQG